VLVLVVRLLLQRRGQDEHIVDAHCRPRNNGKQEQDFLTWWEAPQLETKWRCAAQTPTAGGHGGTKP